MGVYPSPFRIEEQTLLVEKGAPSFMPCREVMGEVCLGDTSKLERQRPELPSRLGLGFSGQILGHRLDLVELAVLNGDAVLFKNLRHASFAVNHRTSDGPAMSDELFQSLSVYPRRFKERFFPPQVLLQRRRTKHHDSISSTPERHVRGDRGGGGY